MYTTGRCARAASDSEKIGKKLKKWKKQRSTPPSIWSLYQWDLRLFEYISISARRCQAIKWKSTGVVDESGRARNWASHFNMPQQLDKIERRRTTPSFILKPFECATCCTRTYTCTDHMIHQSTNSMHATDVIESTTAEENVKWNIGRRSWMDTRRDVTKNQNEIHVPPRYPW